MPLNMFAAFKGRAHRQSAQWDPEHPANWQEDYPHENGMYNCLCADCQIVFMGHKRRALCKLCSQKTPIMGIRQFRFQDSEESHSDLHKLFHQWWRHTQNGHMLTREDLIKIVRDPELNVLGDREAIVQQILIQVPENCRLFPTYDGHMDPTKEADPVIKHTVYFEYPIAKPTNKEPLQ